MRLRYTLPWIVGVLVIFAGIFVARWIGFYYWFENADTLMHTIGGIVAAWIAASLFNGYLAPLGRLGRGAVIISIAVTVGVAWELAEYGATLARDTLPSVYPYFHGGDLADTFTDLCADAFGALIFSIIESKPIWRRDSKKQ